MACFRLNLSRWRDTLVTLRSLAWPHVWKGGKLTPCSGMSEVRLAWVLCIEVKSGGN